MDVAGYVGIPFKSHGRDRSGCDCWGLVRLVLAEQLGVVLPSLVEVYADARRDARQIAREVTARRASWSPVALDRARPGDVVLLRCGGVPAHVGLVVEPRERMMLHVEAEGIAACLEPYDGPVWRHRRLGLFRHPELLP